jgi:hypothetical protein
LGTLISPTIEASSMDRRHWLGIVGSGVGASVGGAKLEADEHRSDQKGNGGMMAPVQSLHAHFCGIHIAKSNPKFQLIAQHYCMSRSEDMHQCLLYDSCEKNAKLLGIEYIVSDRIYRELPDTEKKYWHPHTYEVLSGGLIAPSMRPEDELAFMKALLTTWGKTWHTWPDPTTALPMGEPLLMWSYTKDGQVDPKLLSERDQNLHVSTPAIRLRRADLGPVPQIDPPKSLDQIGRQWTNDGPDEQPRK